MSKFTLEIFEDMKLASFSIIFFSSLGSLLSLASNNESLFAISQFILLISSLGLIVIGIAGLIYNKKCQKKENE